MVMEDGRVRNLKLVEGSPVLAQSAMDAVKQWRYKPFLLDGKPTKRETTVTIDFKLPSDGR
jgi:protein TonB